MFALCVIVTRGEMFFEIFLRIAEAVLRFGGEHLGNVVQAWSEFVRDCGQLPVPPCSPLLVVQGRNQHYRKLSANTGTDYAQAPLRRMV